jgi:hypothetical protein
MIDWQINEIAGLNTERIEIMNTQDLIANIELPQFVNFDEAKSMANEIVKGLTQSQIGSLYNHYASFNYPLVDNEGRPYARDQFDGRFYPVSKEKWLANLPNSVAADIRLAIAAKRANGQYK